VEQWGSGGGGRHVVGLGRGSVGHRGRHWPESAERERRADRRAFKIGEQEVTDRWGHAAQSWAAWFDLIRIQIQTNSNVTQIISNFDPSKKGTLELKKIKIKYGSEGIEEMIDFLHRNFSRFEMDFK
jgi:hypothetical protein